MKLLKRLKLLFCNAEEVEQLLKAIREENEMRERRANAHRLKLCFKHRQEANHSHYSEDNCQYCQLLKEYRRACQALDKSAPQSSQPRNPPWADRPGDL